MTVDGIDIGAAERVVLGAMLLDVEAVHEVTPVVTGRDFHQPRHEVVFDAVTHLVSVSSPHDAVAVGAFLAERGDLARSGGQTYLHELVAACAAPSQAWWYARQVKEASMKRSLRVLGERLSALSESDGDAVDVIAKARTHLEETAEGARVEDVMPPGAAIDDALASLAAPPGPATPWPSLTELVGGWQPSRMYVPAARPSVGKSVVSIEIALHMAKQGKTAMLFNLEMSRRELWLRMLSREAMVDGQRITHRRLRPEDEEKLWAARDRLARLPLVVECTQRMTVAQMEAKVRQEMRRNEVGIVIGDYLGLFEPSSADARQDRRIQVGGVSRDAKRMAMQFGLPVVMLAQLNRESTKRTDGRPALADLRDSGDIEQDADVVLLLHRDISNREGSDPSQMVFDLAKNRGGPTAVITDMVFQGHYSRISEPGGWGQ